MVTIMSLWLPILISAVFVFVVSSIIHMFLPYHKGDFKKLPDEDNILSALSNYKIPPGDYIFPHAGSMEAMKSEAYLSKMKQGPVAFMTVCENGPPKMGGALLLWFVYSIIISVCAAYIASRALAPDAHYLEVFRFTGATAFGGYSLALLQNSIWYKRNWGTTIKSMFDGLIYAMVTAGVFGWLWA